MEYTHLSEFHIRPGALAVWHGELAPGHQWQDDPRPLTTVHSLYCYGTDPADPRPGKGKWIGTVWEMDAPLEHEAWAETLRLWHARHEGLRTTPKMNADGGPTRLVCAPDAVTIVHEEFPEVTGSDEINAFLTDVSERSLSPLVWPHVLFGTVDHGDGNFTVLVAADHSAFDAYSQAIVVLEMRLLYDQVRNGQPIRESETFLSACDYAQYEVEQANALTIDDPGVTVWRDMLEAADGTMPAFAPELHPDPLPENPEIQTSVNYHLLTLEEQQTLEAALDVRKHRMSVAVNAALALAYKQTFGIDSFRAIMPIASRPDLRWLESMGWFVNVVPVDITVDDTNAETVLASTRDALRRTRDANNTSWTRALELLGFDGGPRLGISFLDVRILPEYDVLEKMRARALRAECYSPDEVFLWILRAPDGLRVSTRFPATFPREAMDRYLEAFTTAMRSFADLSSSAVTESVLAG
ncbi:condensation domain-containing protein [Nocardia stercoris]|uniref:Condensation domain-containing protein n=1 Tax=Nocardia stercoris TaxID=2483361 RepID=A0A3M2LKB9_9NOCA|nr:condensation domain-containing protein [Nocardia stercoris]RMI35208.1 hypothetical protein EBN03_02625 [Nocardia stercoris]